MLAAAAMAAADFATGAANAAVGAHYDRQLQDSAQQFAEKQMKNKYQWGVEDLKKSGLNPVLAAGQTQGVSAVGAAPRGGIPKGANMAENIMTAKQAENIQADTELKKEMKNTEVAKQGNLGADTGLKGTQTTQTAAQAENLKQQLSLLKNEEKSQLIDLALQYQNARTEAEKQRLTEIFYKSGFGAFMKHTGLTLGEIGQILGPTSNAIKGKGGLTIQNFPK